MVTVLSLSPTSRRSFAFPFPSAGTSSSCGGELDQRQTSQRHPAAHNICEYDYIRQISTRRPRSWLLTLLGGRAAE
jgi:hypothetical protein